MMIRALGSWHILHSVLIVPDKSYYKNTLCNIGFGDASARKQSKYRGSLKNGWICFAWII